MTETNQNQQDPWYDTNDQQNKEARQKAADTFLQKALENPDDPGSFRERVRDDEGVAFKEFAALYKECSGRELPNGVRVICLEPDLESRSNLVVFLLPTVSAAAPNEPKIPPSWPDAWIAAWQPY